MAADNGETQVGETAQMVFVDLGKKKRKQVKRLRQGRGTLADKVRDVVRELHAGGEASAGDVIVVVVEKKARSVKPFRW